MSDIVFKFSNLAVLGANAGGSRWAHGVDLGVIPVTVSVRSSGMVASHDVVGMGDPDGSWGLVSVEETP